MQIKEDEKSSRVSHFISKLPLHEQSRISAISHINLLFPVLTFGSRRLSHGYLFMVFRLCDKK